MTIPNIVGKFDKITAGLPRTDDAKAQGPTRIVRKFPHFSICRAEVPVRMTHTEARHQEIFIM